MNRRTLLRLGVMLAAFACFLLAVWGLYGRHDWALRTGALCLLAIAAGQTFHVIRKNRNR